VIFRVFGEVGVPTAFGTSFSERSFCGELITPPPPPIIAAAGGSSIFIGLSWRDKFGDNDARETVRRISERNGKIINGKNNKYKINKFLFL
jgi:hypothetical protein